MKKTLKEIFVPLASNKLVAVPAGTYLINKGFNKYSFIFEGFENYCIEVEELEKYPDTFLDVSSDEPEIYEIVRKFSDLLDRQDMKETVYSIEKTDPETVLRIRKFFGGEDVTELQKRIKELETKLFISEMNKTNPYQVPGSAEPYRQPVLSNCRVCGIDFSKNTNYVCGNSACPQRTIYFSTTSDTAGNTASLNAMYTIKKEEEE